MGVHKDTRDFLVHEDTQIFEMQEIHQNNFGSCTDTERQVCIPYPHPTPRGNDALIFWVAHNLTLTLSCWKTRTHHYLPATTRPESSDSKFCLWRGTGNFPRSNIASHHLATHARTEDNRCGCYSTLQLTTRTSLTASNLLMTACESAVLWRRSTTRRTEATRPPWKVSF